MYANNANISITQNTVNQSMFISNTPGPITFILMFQGLWFAKTFKWVFMYVSNQFKNFFYKFRFVFRPVFQIFNYRSIKNCIAHGSFKSWFEKSCNSCSLRLLPYPLLRFSIALFNLSKYSLRLSLRRKPWED